MNSNTIPTSPNQWNMDIQMPYYQQTDHFELANTPYESFSQDSTIMNTSTYPSHVTISSYSNLSPENSSGNGDHQLSPKTSTISKPVRRRSRASKKTPTTLVNASISNFRAVVQQYTGCHTSPIKNQRGPINLSFGPQTDDFLESSIGEGSHYGYYSHEEAANKEQKQEYFQESGSPAGYSNSGNSRLSIEDYGCQ
uniref:VQ motif-containing protein 22 n=2 Tax=Nicotiana TaxID=4085 RepID=A0A1S4DG11_TOBAC|nr:PREDICTED: VQ motif-containing protein 22-like [Nicotiana tabacum]